MITKENLIHGYHLVEVNQGVHNKFFYDKESKKWFMDYTKSIEVTLPETAKFFPCEYFNLPNLLKQISILEKKNQMLLEQKENGYESQYIYKWIEEESIKYGDKSIDFKTFCSVIASYMQLLDASFDKEHPLHYIRKERKERGGELKLLYEYYLNQQTQ